MNRIVILIGLSLIFLKNQTGISLTAEMVSPDTISLQYFLWPPEDYTIRGLGKWDTLLLATRFNPKDFTDPNGNPLGYPLKIKEVTLFFFQFPDHPWTSERFRIFVYGDDGMTELYKSEEIPAVKNQDANNLSPTLFKPSKPVEIERGKFWVAVKTGDSISPALIYVKPSQRHSFEGVPGNWYVVDGEWMMRVNVSYTPSTGVEKDSRLLTSLTLEVKGPLISYSLNRSGPLTLEILDILGRPVRRWIFKRIERGRHTIVWDGSGLSNGIYFYKLSSSNSSLTKKVILMR